MVRSGIFVLVAIILPGIIGGIIAYRKGRNIVGWTIVSALFPFFLVVLWFKDPLREVPQGYRRCPSCNYWVRWNAAVCKYCRNQLQPR